MDDRQSNFDETTGTFVVASDNAVIAGVTSAATCRPTRRATSGRASGSPTTSSATARRSSAAAFGVFWNFTPGGTSSSKAQNPPFLQSTALTTSPTRAYGDQPARSRTACRRLRASTRTVRRPARRARSSTSTSATRSRGSGTSTCSARSAHNYMVEVAYVGSQGPHMLIKGDPNQAPPIVGRHQLEHQLRPSPRSRRRCATVGQVQSKGRLNYNGAAREVPAALREQLLVPELVHLRQGAWTSTPTTTARSR